MPVGFSNEVVLDEVIQMYSYKSEQNFEKCKTILARNKARKALLMAPKMKWEFYSEHSPEECAEILMKEWE